MKPNDTEPFKPTVSVVIRTLNEAKHLGSLIAGIKRQRDVDAEIVVVDSGSTDTTVEIAASFDARIIHIAAKDFSFGRSLNRGVAAATGEIVVAASAHVYPIGDTWLADLVAPFGDPETALSYGRQIGDEDSAFSERMILATWFPAKSEPNQRHPFCNNANAAIRKSVWERIRYDEDLTGLEDLDWAKRAMAAGHRVAYVSTATIVHAHRESWDRVVNRYQREAIAHRRLYHEQKMSGTEAVSLWGRNVARDIVAATRQGAFTKEAWNIARFRAAQFLGTYRGFAQEGSVPSMLKRRFYYPGSREAGNGDVAPQAKLDPVSDHD